MHPWWMTDIQDQAKWKLDDSLERAEREDANKRLREWRCEELFRTIVNLGLEKEAARRIAEGVWEEKVSWISLQFAGHKLVGFNRDERSTH